MKYDVSAFLLDHRQKPIRLNAAVDEGARLRDVLELVCISPHESIKTAEEKIRIYRILQRTMAADPLLELEASEVALLKKMIAETYPPVLCGVLFDVLEAPIAPVN